MQGPAIRAAKDMGLETVAVDGDPAAPLAGEADRFEQIDLKDIHAITKLARSLQADGGLRGVMTAGTDFSASAAWTADQCGRPGIPSERALDASDKERMRRRFAEAGVPSPPHIVCTGPPETPRSGSPAGDGLPFPFPVVVKPVDNMGGRGCRRADNRAELREAVESALAFSRSRRAIVEAYMEGPEFSLDALVYRGEVTICGLADRHIFFPPYFIEMGHTMPSAFPQTAKDALIEVFIRGIRALGIDNGAAKGDIKLTPRGPMIGEIAARLSGGYMSGWTYPYSSGVDPVRGAIRIALGLPPEDLQPRRDWTSAERAFISIPGLVQSIEGTGRARAVPGVKDIFLRAGPGKRLSFPENNVSKAGNVISAAPDREDAVTAAETAARTILIRLAAPDPETAAFLAGPGTPDVPDAGAFPPPAFAADRALLDKLAALPGTTTGPQDSPGRPGAAAAPAAVPVAANSAAGAPSGVFLVPFPAFTESDLRDYMGRTPAETLEAVRTLTGLALPEAPADAPAGENAAGASAVLGREFWAALVRGGYQGAVYYIDALGLAAGTGGGQ
jgi:biotin carboxylase